MSKKYIIRTHFAARATRVVINFYLHSGPRPSIWGKVPVSIEIEGTYIIIQETLSRDIDINIFGISTSNYPIYLGEF